MMHRAICVVFFANAVPMGTVRNGAERMQPCLPPPGPALPTQLLPRTRTGECGFKPPELAPVQEQCSPHDQVQVSIVMVFG